MSNAPTPPGTEGPTGCPAQGERIRGGLFSLRDQNPYDRYRAILDEGGWRWDDDLSGWIIADYRSACAVLSDEDRFAFPPDLPAGQRILHGKRGIFMLQDDIHREFHLFLARRLNRLAGSRRALDTIDPVVERELARVHRQDAVEAFVQLAQRIPIRVVSGLLGLPWNDDDLMSQCLAWLESIARWVETYGLEQNVVDEALSAAANLESILATWANPKMADPFGLITGIRDLGRRFFDDWDEFDTLTHAKLLMLAGSHTTTSLIASLMAQLALDQALQSWVRREPQDRVPVVVEELVRIHPPVHVKARTARRDVVVQGREILAGTRIYVLIGAANRDHDKFPSGGAVDRQSHRGQPEHLGFNIGPRFCVGAGLARAEAVHTVRGLLAETDGFELDHDAPAPELRGLMLRTLRPVHLRLHRRKASV